MNSANTDAARTEWRVPALPAHMLFIEAVIPTQGAVWSAGGDLSNWALVSTDRFKAISSGASSTLPRRYIKNAKTPILIHCGEDEKYNMRQSEGLHIALKELGVPTEFIVYPNTGHIIGIIEYGIGNMKFQMVKMQAEFYWFEKWIKGKEQGWIDCKKMIEALKKE